MSAPWVSWACVVLVGVPFSWSLFANVLNPRYNLGDARVFFDAARLVLAGHSPYNAPYTKGGHLFVNFPWIAAILIWGAHLPLATAAHIWTFLNELLAVVSTALVLWRIGARRYLYAALLIVLTPTVMFVSVLGQVDVIMAVLWVAAVVCLDTRHSYWAGVLIMAAFLTKFDVAWIFLPTLLLLGHRRDGGAPRKILMGMGVSFIVLVVPFFVWRPMWVPQMVTALRAFSGTIAGNQTWLVGLPALWRLIPSFGGWGEWGLALMSVTSLVLIVGAVVLLRSAWKAIPEGFRGDLFFMSLVATVWLIVSPYGHEYDLVVALPLLLTPHARIRFAVAAILGLLGPAEIALFHTFSLYVAFDGLALAYVVLWMARHWSKYVPAKGREAATGMESA